MKKLMKKMLGVSSAVGMLASGFSALQGAEESKNLGSIWCIGDSITQGNADGSVTSTPRSELYTLLKEKGYSFSFTGHHTRNPEGLPKNDENFLYHSGVSGIRIGQTEGEKTGFAKELERFWRGGILRAKSPSIVLVMLGTNDVGGGFELETGATRLKTLVESIYDLKGIDDPTVLVATIPPNRRVEHDRTNVIIFNSRVNEIVLELKESGKKVHLVDQFTALDQRFDEVMSGDKLHTNALGNKVIAETWVEKIEELSNSDAITMLEPETPAKFPGLRTKFKGYESYRVRTSDGQFEIITPEKPAPGKPWLWRSLFWHAIGQVNEADLKLVDEGYHVVIAHGEVSGHPSGNKNISAAYNYVVNEHGFNKKVSMSSMSRGNLSLFRWATENPEKVASIYVDNGVCNLRSWPGGKSVPGNENAIANGDPSSWAHYKRVFGFSTDAEALAAKESPIDLLEPLAKHQVPIIMVCGMKDHAVPFPENGAIMKERYEKLGGPIELLCYPNKGHSHGLADPSPVLDFIRKHF